MSKRCPSCRTEVADDARVCPNCPWMFPDEDQEPEVGAPPTAVATHWSPLPLVFFGLFFFIVFGVWFYFVRQSEKGAATPLEPETPLTIPQPTLPQVEPPAPPAPVATVTKPEPPAKPPEAGSKTKKPKASARPPKSEDEEEEEAPSPVVTVLNLPPEPPPKPLPPVKEWKLRGFVYDLITLRPVSHCRLVLSDIDTNARFETTTDGSGRYRAILPPLPDRGYLVTISQNGYAPTYVDPGTEGVRSKSGQERQSLCRELVGAVLQPASLQPRRADPLQTDFYLAPVSCR